MTGSSYEGGITTDKADFGVVLKMYERRRGAEKYPNDHDIHKDTFVGNAVLVGPRLAITAVHCLADPKQNLWVRSALGESYVKVIPDSLRVASCDTRGENTATSEKCWRLSWPRVSCSFSRA